MLLLYYYYYYIYCCCHYYYILLFIGIITIIYKYIFMLYYILYILCYFYILSNNNITIISTIILPLHLTLSYLPIYLVFLFFILSTSIFFYVFYCIVFYCLQIYRLLWQLNFPSGMNKVLYLSIYLSSICTQLVQDNDLLFYWGFDLLYIYIYINVPLWLSPWNTAVLQSGVKINPSVLGICLFLGRFCRKRENVTDVLLIRFDFSICLCASEVSCCISFRPPAHTPPSAIRHRFKSGCQSALLVFKGSGAWNRDSEHGPDFNSLIFPPHFPVSQSASLFCVSLFCWSLEGRAEKQQASVKPWHRREDQLLLEIL